MTVKEIPTPTQQEIQLARDEICRSWSPGERDRRERVAKLRQEWLFAVLLARPAALSARVA